MSPPTIGLLYESDKKGESLMCYEIELNGIDENSKVETIYKNISSEHSAFFGNQVVSKAQVIDLLTKIVTEKSKKNQEKITSTPITIVKAPTTVTTSLPTIPTTSPATTSTSTTTLSTAVIETHEGPESDLEEIDEEDQFDGLISDDLETFNDKEEDDNFFN